MTPNLRNRPAALSFLLALLVGGCTEAPEPADLAHTILEPVVEVGLLDGPEEFLFGEVTDVRALSDGSFVVLDRQAPALRRFALEGDYLGGITGAGQGPGELETPVAVAITANDRVAVLDQGNARISVFRTAAHGLEHDDDVHTGALDPYAANRQSLCASGEDWFVQHLEEGGAIQRYDASGEPTGTLQSPLPVPAEFGAYAMIMEPSINSGILRCTADGPAVVFAGFRSDTVRAYDADGVESWRQGLPGVSPEGYQLEPIFGYQSESEGSHVAMSVVRWTEESLLVQYRFWSGSRSDPDSIRVDSFELSLETGELLSQTDALPQIRDTRGRYVYSIEAEPYPRVRVWER